ncbi:MAG: plastocyanin/azurin family copper-binding protein [Patescibacteria group bacterium]
MKKILLSVVVLLLLVGGYLFVSKKPVNETVEITKQEKIVEETKEVSPSAMEEDVKTFKVDGSNFKFSVTEMKVKQGDKVKIVFTPKSGFHDWVLDEFNAKTKQLAAGATETVEFVADKKGTFEYYCSVGQHRKMGMVGSLIVE